MSELKARFNVVSPAVDDTNYPSESSRRTSVWRGILVSLRPYQWVKNTLVFGALIFSRSLSHRDAVLLAVGGFISFCMASSGIYLLNDISDLKEDRAHPVKRLRPLASGAISTSTAAIVMALLLVGSLFLGFRLGAAFGLTLSLYLVINVAYSLRLKHMVILDVMILSMCFVLRAVAGAVVIDVKASAWLILCTLMLALLVGFGKRRHEIVLLNQDAGNHRASLQEYSLPFLDLMMAISAGAALVTYALYTMADETVQRFGSRGLMLTVPFVVYGVFRYLFLIHQRKDGGDPARLFITDIPTILNVVIWVSVTCVVLYGSSSWLPW
jgi:4-hydroxybenzoate polyprenyltransferase